MFYSLGHLFYGHVNVDLSIVVKIYFLTLINSKGDSLLELAYTPNQGGTDLETKKGKGLNGKKYFIYMWTRVKIYIRNKIFCIKYVIIL